MNATDNIYVKAKSLALMAEVVNDCMNIIELAKIDAPVDYIFRVRHVITTLHTVIDVFKHDYFQKSP